MAGFAFLWNRNMGGVRESVVLSEKPAPAPLLASTAAQTGAVSEMPPSPPPPSPEVGSFTRLQQATDYRVLFESLLAHPDRASGLYAQHLLRICWGVQRAVAEGVFEAAASTSSAQDEAQQKIKALCASFIEQELTIDRLGELMQDPRITGSELLQIAGQLHGGSSPEERAQWVARVLAERDPLLLESAGARLFALNPADAQGRTSVTFDGQTYDQPKAIGVFQLAVQGAACEAYGHTCGAGDALVLDACASRGICTGSRSETIAQVLRQQGGEGALALYERIRPRLIRALREGDVSAFVPSNAPGSAPKPVVR